MFKIYEYRERERERDRHGRFGRNEEQKERVIPLKEVSPFEVIR